MTDATPHAVCVLGVWHLGLVTSTCLAELGYEVIGFDRDAARVQLLNKGHAPVHEPGIEVLLAAQLGAGRLRYTADLDDAMRTASYVLVAYDTPVDEKDELDLSEIYWVARALAQCAAQGVTIIVSSQVPVGMCEELAKIIGEVNPSLAFGIACVPENLRLGQAIERFRHPDMIVVGADTPNTLRNVKELLSPIEAPMVAADLRTAEMTKHAINAYLALCISFANELANVSDLVGADAGTVIDALRLESRVSPRAPLFPGLGFAGGTLARDMNVLRSLSEKHGYEAPLINGILRANELQNRMVLKRLEQFYGSLTGLTIGVLGLTYKPGTSTLRRSASIEIIRAMASVGARVRAYDPLADPGEVAPHRGYFTRCESPYEVAEGSHALVIVTPWPEFKELDFSRLRSVMKNPFLLDAQNALDAERMRAIGFVYQGVGRGDARATRGVDV